MAFNGSGVHNRIHDWTQDLTNAIPVTASRMDAEHDDISTALSTTICRDGQSTTTARIPFASGLSTGSGSAASAAYAQTNDLNTGLYFPATDQWGLTAGGTTTLSSTSTKVTMSVAVDFTGAAAPTSNDGAALGSISQKWSDLFLANGAVINFNNGDVLINHAGANVLRFQGAAVSFDNGIFPEANDVGSLGDGILKWSDLFLASGAVINFNNGDVTVTHSANQIAVAGGTLACEALSPSGDVAVATNKFTVASASGNTAIAGTLAVTGASTFTGLMTGRIPLLHVREEQAAGTNGGTFTSGAWRTRVLNIEKTNEISGAALASNQIVLPAGTYEIEATAPAATVNGHIAKLANITDGTDVIIGTVERTDNAGSFASTRSLVRGRFTLAAQKTLELQHRCESTQTTAGFGDAANIGVVEVYSEVMIKKVT